MKLKKIGEVWNSRNRLLSDFNSLLSSTNFATMATWRNDFSFLLLTQEPITQDEQLHASGQAIQLITHILIKCYLELFAFISDPENWITNVT